MVRGGIFVSTENNGLRFDIYERVNLPENVAAIEELEEIELVPRIQVIDQGEYVLLQGQLVLNGIYRGEGFGQEQIALEHWIPVEISLPMSRVQQLDDVTVDIDSFHVEPVSERALNITGVLALRGIYLEEQGQQWGAEGQYEDLSFVSEAQVEDSDVAWREESTEDEQNQENWFAQEEEADVLQQEQNVEHEQVEWREYEESSLDEETQQQESDEWQQESEADAVEQIESANENEFASYEEAAWESSFDEQAQHNFREDALEESVESQEEADFAAAYTEEQAYYSEADYTALSNNEADESQWQAAEVQPAKVTTSFSIKDILSSSLREQAANEVSRLEAERNRIEEQLQQAQNKSEPIEWRSMLLQADGKEQFRKIKMYIVQKNDTLELIAGKYDINPRDLLNHNKLHETAISEGQLLYIP